MCISSVMQQQKMAWCMWQEAEGVVRDLERQLERYAQAAIFLSRQLPFHQLIQMTSVTHLIPQGKNSTETVLLHAPAWETTAACPPQWSQVCNRVACQQP